MILSRTSQYAIQALIYMATQPEGVPVLNRTIAEHLSVPPAYLAKIMQSLGRGGILYSFRGKQGGFCLREGAEKTDLMKILTLVEGPGLTEECVMGLKICSDRTACPMHEKWKPIKVRIVELLEKQTLEKLAAAVKSGKYRLSELPFGAMSLPAMPTVTKKAEATKPEAKKAAPGGGKSAAASRSKAATQGR